VLHFVGIKIITYDCKELPVLQLTREQRFGQFAGKKKEEWHRLNWGSFYNV